MKRLYDVYAGKLNPSWWQKMLIETKRRIQQSQSTGYIPHSRDKTFGRWTWSEQRTRRNHDDYDDDFYQDLAKDCGGWEDDMVKNGEFF